MERKVCFRRLRVISSTECTSRAVMILTVIICLTAAGVAYASTAGAATIAVSKSDDTGFQASLDLSNPVISLKSTKAGEFVEAGWPGAGKSGGVGKPALPVLRSLFLAPLGAEVSVEASEGQAVIIDLKYRLMPVQPPIEKLPGAMERAVFQMDAGEYAKNEYDSEERVTVEEVGIVRGHRLFLLEMRPVAYNPAAGTIKFWPRLSAKVSFKGGGRGPAGSLSAMQGLDRVVINPEMLPDDGKVSANYLIVVAEAFETAIEPFATAKQAQGYTVTTYSASPGTTNAAIKSYIQGLWGTADAPDYILLVGDTDTIPNWKGGGEGKPNTDLPYTCMDAGDDWHPDIAIGRFPVRSTSQLADVVNKTLAFEDGLYADNEYPARAVFMASCDHSEITEGTHNWVIDNYMTPNGIICDKLYCGATTQDVSDAFNDGRLYGVYSGHGGEYRWADGPAFNQSNVRNLTNTDLYPFVFSFACVTGSYMLTECFAETWLLTADNGAVAIYASSVNSYWTEDDQLERCLFQSLFDDDIREIGPCWNTALERYLTAMGAGSTTRRYFEMYNLMGDPSAYVPKLYNTPTVQYSWNMDVNPGWTTTGQWAWGQPTGGGGEYGGPDPTGGYTGNNVYGYNLNGDYSNNMPEYYLETTAINCSNLTRVRLKFQRWLGVERSAYDHATIQVSNDETNWAQIWPDPCLPRAAIQDSSWTLQSHDISAIADNQAQVFIRWTMGPTDGSYRFCGWNIDDVEILGVGDECFPTTPEYAQQYADFLEYKANALDASCWCSDYGAEGAKGNQCYGDAAGDVYISRGYIVYTTDLRRLSDSWKAKFGDSNLDPCADLDHVGHVRGYRVYSGDLGILSTNWKTTALPGDCPPPDSKR